MMRKPHKRREGKPRSRVETSKAPLAYFDDDEEPPAVRFSYGRSLGRKIGKRFTRWEQRRHSLGREKRGHGNRLKVVAEPEYHSACEHEDSSASNDA